MQLFTLFEKNVLGALRTAFTLALFCVVLPNLYATHNRAGEIIVEQLEPCSALMVKATIVTYTKASSISADRDSLEICWGDGSCEMVARSNGNGNGVNIGNDTKYNLYIAYHTYPGRGTYSITMTDPNRNGGILNVNPPNSDQVPFFLQTNYTLLNCQFDGLNSTPVLLQPPIDVACMNRPFIHNPNAIDPDGDSLSYQLVVPMQAEDTPVPNYLWPSQVMPGPFNNYSFNEETGDFIWNAPQQEGEYNIAMIIISWRNGVPIDTVLRDMQIYVTHCDSEVPEIEAPDFICVVAGEEISFEVTATDLDADDEVRIIALGGPFIQEYSPATFDSAAEMYQTPPVTGVFTWQTSCEHISNQVYTVIFKAEDNTFGDHGLTNLKTMHIKVVGPPPEDLQTETFSDHISLSWEAPYVCEDAADDYFYTFSVWRKENSNNFPVDSCTPGLAGQGYTRIVANTRQLENGRYVFDDYDVQSGRTYCYRVIALFAKLTSLDPPQRYNIVESLPSEEVCAQLSRDLPLMLHADVQVTSATEGEVYVSWSRPLAEDLDTLLHPGPYTYELRRGEGLSPNQTQLIANFTAPAFAEAVDTFFLDTGLNTESSPYFYEVLFYTGASPEPLGSATGVSTVFLQVASTDETNNLSWDYQVSWTNYAFVVYRRNAQQGWDSIGYTTEPFFSDQGLTNGEEYCYYVEAQGSYHVESLPSPLINRSQIRCGIPLDTIPPCPPLLTVNNLCDQGVSCLETDLFNNVSWVNPMNLCEDTDDVTGYNLYHASREGEELVLLYTTASASDTFYVHYPEAGLAGCYAVTAVDTFFNESSLSNIVCIDNCPFYQLPNTFTPNADGQNDLFVPYPYCFVEKVDFRVFNRWGNLVFQTENPDLLWDGRNLRGEALPAGVYFYTCRVFEERVGGTTEAANLLRGYIELIR